MPPPVCRGSGRTVMFHTADSRGGIQTVNHGDGIGGFQNVQEVLRQEIADTDGAHCAFIIEPLQSTPAFRYQRLPICAGEGQGPMNEEQIQILHLQIFEGGFKACHGFIIA